MPAKKRVAVIGCGTSGLIAIKCLKEEEEIEPICFEKTNYIAGTWHYHAEDVKGVPSVTWSTFINNSKEMWAVSDFPPKKGYPNFMRHSVVHQVFTELAENFDLFKHVRFNHEVLSVKKNLDYDFTGKWEVIVQNTAGCETIKDVFDGVLVCSGHLANPIIPDFPGMEKFKGNIIHSHSLKKVAGYADQRVAVVGIGSSGLDAAVEISNVAKQVYLSTRSGAWVVPRIGPKGLPTDYCVLRRYLALAQKIFSLSICSKYFEHFYLNHRFSHKLYNLHPEHNVLARDPAINDTIAAKISSGTVVVKKNIKRFTQNGVVFEGHGVEVTEIDSVVMATGYKWEFPFLEEDTIANEGNRINLYKCVYPPQLKHPTLAIIGFILPLGPGFPIVEMQCRWAVHLLTDKGSLPTEDTMMKDIIEQYSQNVKRYIPSDRISIMLDYVPYMDDISSKIGAKPNLLKLAFTDPKLFYHCFFGPLLPYQYRLQGPHVWVGARNAIITAFQRIKCPFEVKCDQPSVNVRCLRVFLYFTAKHIFSLLLFLLFIYWKKKAVIYHIITTFWPMIMLFVQSVNRYILKKKTF